MKIEINGCESCPYMIKFEAEKDKVALGCEKTGVAFIGKKYLNYFPRRLPLPIKPREKLSDRLAEQCPFKEGANEV